MPVITSQHNPRLKELRKLARRRERERSGCFLAEGEDLIAAAMAAGRPAIAGYRAAGSAIGGAGFEDVEPSVMSSLSALGSGTRAIGVYEQRFTRPAGPLCVYLHGVADPGNVGAVLRSALAFGASCVALGPGCADPHSPKAVRASMGAIFSVGLARVGGVGELPGTRVALVAGAGDPIWSIRGGSGEVQKEIAAAAPLVPPREGPLSPERGARAEGTMSGKPQATALTLLVGAEREGLPDDVVEACERVAHIPIASESLNAAMAATVALYEMTRPSTRVPAS
ncbi:MAG TPA: RNA methyltransferase [Solirubrobacteraceae bacterium]|jgi:TrmH family RNA methyltransferase|nr:RNA methyltransferase [Solirubrobacteraceae bacterium]